jgi:DNA-binding transcriptional ArsR family regulator
MPDDQSIGLEPDAIEAGSALPPPDDLFRAVADSDRRRLLAVLSTESAMPLDDLTDVLVGWESNVSGPAGPDEWAQVKIELVHMHLPLLSEAGLVTRDDDMVRLDTYSAPVEELVTFATAYEEATA